LKREIVARHKGLIPVTSSYTGGRRLRSGLWFQTSPGKKKKNLQVPPLNGKKAGCSGIPVIHGRKLKIGGSCSRLAWAKSEALSPK
jgi:hypothetical protein